MGKDLLYHGPLPYLSTEQMIEVDRAMIEDYHITLLQMMENAGRALAIVARDRFFGGDPRGRRVVVLAGTGGNGGGALVAARRLHNAGADVTVVITRPDEAFSTVSAHQLDIVRRMGLAVFLTERIGEIGALPAPDLVLDGLIGYSLKGTPRGAAAELIAWGNASDAQVLSLDVPSGVDTTSGRVYDPAIRAVVTLTLALPKAVLRVPEVRPYVGELYLADISVPPALYAGDGLQLEVPPLFAASDIIRLW